MTDLYPEPAWNFFFGEASLIDRVGVYSFARYAPEFWGRKREPGDAARLLRESSKILVHETAHMLGLEHCIYFSCLLNGANNAAEAAAQPQHLCPVCLRKLHHAVGLDLIRRYRDLEQFYR